MIFLDHAVANSWEYEISGLQTQLRPANSNTYVCVRNSSIHVSLANLNMCSLVCIPLVMSEFFFLVYFDDHVRFFGRLLKREEIKRSGAGGRSDPYLYTVTMHNFFFNLAIIWFFFWFSKKKGIIWNWLISEDHLRIWFFFLLSNDRMLLC